MIPKAPDPLPLASAARLLRVLGEPARLRLLVALSGGGELSVGQLAAASGRSLVAVHNQLRPLLVAGVVEFRVEGNRHLYRLASEPARYLLGLVRQGGA
jgi:DNA-binding transcriptional ArsR family regulator